MKSPAKNTRAAWLNGPFAECPTSEEVAHPWRLILLGPPASAKAHRRICSAGDWALATSRLETFFGPPAKGTVVR
jgi:hypothetical protein